MKMTLWLHLDLCWLCASTKIEAIVYLICRRKSYRLSLQVYYLTFGCFVLYISNRSNWLSTFGRICLIRLISCPNLNPLYSSSFLPIQCCHSGCSDLQTSLNFFKNTVKYMQHQHWQKREHCSLSLLTRTIHYSTTYLLSILSGRLNNKV